MFDQLIPITIGLLVLSMIAFFFKIFFTKYDWTRLLLLNLISAKVILVLVLYAVYEASEMLLDIALTYGVISFLTMTLFSKFVIAGGKHK
ncbi:MAG: pH regulation protein F [Firmicutes bacterium]|nr:pH regulation protein F [Bacillota bacterium]